MASVRVNTQYRPRHCFECWLPCMSRSAQKSKQGRKKREVPIDGAEAWRNFVLDEDDDPLHFGELKLWKMQCNGLQKGQRWMDAARWVWYTPLSCLSSEIATDAKTRGCLVGDHHPWNAAQLKGEKCKQLPENIWWVWVGIPLPGKHGCA